jgi:hypothetical protein
MANKDMYRRSHGVPEPRLVPRGEGVLSTIYPRERRAFVPRGEPRHREGVGKLGLGVVSLLDVPSLVANTSMGGMIAVLGPRGSDNPIRDNSVLSLKPLHLVIKR